MTNMYGRQTIVPLTNKSGGGVIAGDVVIIDTANDTAFTTTTSGQAEVTVGIAQETIASNATGRVLTHGYAALVNVPSSMTRGRYLETHTVVKQATGSATRRAGSFGQFLTGGTTPTAILWGQTDQTASGTSAGSAHGCRVHRASGNVSLGSSTFTVIGWDAEDHDTDTMHDTVTNNSRIVIPTISGVTTGLWAMTMKGYTDAPGSTRSDAMFRKNAAGVNSGGTLIGIAIGAHPDSGVGPVMGYEEWVLSAADYVEVFVRTTGGSGNLLFDSTTLPSFSMAFLGKVS